VKQMNIDVVDSVLCLFTLFIKKQQLDTNKSGLF